MSKASSSSKPLPQRTGLPAVTEVVEVADVGAVHEHADAFQVGARNMQNFRLLKELGKSDKPVILKRGMAATVKDLLLAGEYIVQRRQRARHLLRARHPHLRNGDTATPSTSTPSPSSNRRATSPSSSTPSHGTGVRDLVAPMARAAAACGADGIMVETHRNPAEAWSDGAQSLFLPQLEELVRGLRPFVEAAGKKL